MVFFLLFWKKNVWHTSRDIYVYMSLQSFMLYMMPFVVSSLLGSKQNCCARCGMGTRDTAVTFRNMNIIGSYDFENWTRELCVYMGWSVAGGEGDAREFETAKNDWIIEFCNKYSRKLKFRCDLRDGVCLLQRVCVSYVTFFEFLHGIGVGDVLYWRHEI